MRCPSCGFENPEGLKFCNDCGAPLQVRCPQCGFANQPRARFCGECGTSLASLSHGSPAPPLAPGPQAPLSYTPPHLAERILHTKSALEGERKQVTVLFADLKGSMELLADRDPKEARKLLDPVLERMMDAVHCYEGTVNQVMGDGIMALFGAPIAHEDHAVRACYAALRMQERVTRYGDDMHRSHGVPLQIRVGLNAGAVVVRAIDSSLHMDYTAVGQTTHLAARMEQMAKPGSVLLTVQTLRLVEGLVQVKPLGLVTVKGLSDAVEVFEPIRDLLKAYFQLEARDDERRIREKVTGELLTLDETLKSTQPALLALLDVPVEDCEWLALDPPQRRQQILDALKRLLLRESQVRPLLVVCENLHWIDTETRAFLDSLVESLPTARILLLVNYRPEYQHTWGSKTYYTQLRIDPLPPTNTEALLQALLGDDAGLEPLTRVLIERTEGNPFFLEESVRTLIETQVLIGEPGAYRLGRPLLTIRVPATVQAVLAARMDRLPAEDKTLLQTAAVIGKDVPFPLLQAIAELPEEALRGAPSTTKGTCARPSLWLPQAEATLAQVDTFEASETGAG
jgi:class 3 adenylate cyclase